MSVKLRILSIRLIEKLQSNPKIAQKLGVDWCNTKDNSSENNDCNQQEKI